MWLVDEVGLISNDLTIFHFDKPVANVKIPVVMADHNHGLPPVSQFRKNLEVKHLTEKRILVSGPLVKNIHRPVLQIRGEQSQALALPVRKVDC